MCYRDKCSLWRTHGRFGVASNDIITGVCVTGISALYGGLTVGLGLPVVIQLRARGSYLETVRLGLLLTMVGATGGGREGRGEGRRERRER